MNFIFFCASDGQWGYCQTVEEDTSKEEEEGGEGGEGEGGSPKDEEDSSGKIYVLIMIINYFISNLLCPL